MEAIATLTSTSGDIAPVGPNNPLLVSLGSNTASLSGYGYSSQSDIARPNNATPYTAGDVIGAADVGTPANAGVAAIEFTNIGPAGGHILITDVDLRIDVNAVPAGMVGFRLHLYNVTPPSALLDNAVWDLPAGDRASYLGYIDTGVPVDVGSTLFVQSSYPVNKKVKMGATTSLFGYLVTLGGYTPTAVANKSVRLNALGA